MGAESRYSVRLLVIVRTCLQVVNDMFKSFMTEDKILEMVSKSQEFEQIKVSFLLTWSSFECAQ